MKPLPIVCILFAFCPPSVARPGGTLTLPEAVDRALGASAEVRAAARGVHVREALALQAGARPNPELRAEVENVGGSGSRQGFEETETTVRLAQRLELGGKRAARLRVAESERGLADRDHEVVRLDVVARTTRAYVATLAAQERLALAAEMERLARETVGAIERSVGAGASAPVEAGRARVAAARAGVERAQAERALAGARMLLAATWGERRPRFARVAGSLSALGRLPAQAELMAALDRNPALTRWTTERDARGAAVALEQARRVPDVMVGAGGRHFSDNGDNALVFEVSMPLPVFDRNRGAVAAARERLAQARDEADAARARARTALTEAYVRLTDAHATAAVLTATVLPDARRSVAATVDAFHKGTLHSIDVLGMRRTLVEMERERLDALERFHLAAADIAQLTATPIGESMGGDR